MVLVGQIPCHCVPQDTKWGHLDHFGQTLEPDLFDTYPGRFKMNYQLPFFGIDGIGRLICISNRGLYPLVTQVSTTNFLIVCMILLFVN